MEWYRTRFEAEERRGEERRRGIVGSRSALVWSVPPVWSVRQRLAVSLSVCLPPEVKMAISQDEIVSNAQTVTKGLEALRVEHQAMLGGMKKRAEAEEKAETAASKKGNGNGNGDDAAAVLLEEKCGLIEKSLEMIDLGLDEAHVMSALASHLQSVEAEKQVRTLNSLFDTDRQILFWPWPTVQTTVGSVLSSILYRQSPARAGGVSE